VVLKLVVIVGDENYPEYEIVDFMIKTKNFLNFLNIDLKKCALCGYNDDYGLTHFLIEHTPNCLYSILDNGNFDIASSISNEGIKIYT